MRVKSTDFQNAVGRYLALVEKEDVIITKNGRSVAKITAYTNPTDFLVKEAKGQYNVKMPISYEEYLELVEGSDQRYELINGEIYLLASPSFRHQVIVRDLTMALQSFLVGGPCQALSAPLDIYLFGWATKFSEDPNVVQPDVVVICDTESVTEDGKYEGIPTLVAEVLSPSTKGKDLITKLELYMRSGIREYWIVDPETKTITQYSFDAKRVLEDAKILQENDVLQSSFFPEFQLALSGIFRTANSV